MNIAEILKYCPKGTKLYSSIWGDVKLIEVTSTEVIKIKIITTEKLTSDGCYSVRGECVLFPSKDQRDWNKFRLPVKRGDIMMHPDGSFAFIASGEINPYSYPMAVCGINSLNNTLVLNSKGAWTSEFYIPASEEIKKELFDKMAEAGYKWNADTLELEKIESKFKEGDVIINNQGTICLVSKMKDNGFITIVAALYTSNTLKVFTSNTVGRFVQQSTIASTTDKNKLYSALVKEGYKYNKEKHLLIKQEFKPFDKVLVRDNETESWNADIYLEYLGDTYLSYKCACSNYRICIPYEGNEYLLGTTNSPT